MVEPAELPSRRPKEEKTPEEKRKEFKVIKGGGRKGWGPGAKAGAIVGSTAAVVSGVAAALGETDNLPDPLQGFYNQAFHPGKVAEEKSEQALRGKYDVEEVNEDFAKIVKETKETQETPLVIEEKTPGPIEWEGAIIPAIEGLRFDKGTFFAEAGNPYNLEIGEKAGVFIKEAVEINEKMESAIGLTPKVISFIQKENFEKTKEQLFPIVFDLTVTKDVEMHELKTAGDEIGKKILAFNAPVGSEFLAPLSGNWGMFKPFPNVEDNCFFTDWNIGKEENLGGIDIYFKEAKILAEMKEGPSIPNLKTGTRQTLMSTHVELGDSLGMISSQISLEEFSRSGWGEYQLVTFLKNNDKIMEVGSGTNTYRVFILP